MKVIAAAVGSIPTDLHCVTTMRDYISKEVEPTVCLQVFVIIIYTRTFGGGGPKQTWL